MSPDIPVKTPLPVPREMVCASDPCALERINEPSKSSLASTPPVSFFAALMLLTSSVMLVIGDALAMVASFIVNALVVLEISLAGIRISFTAVAVSA